MTLPIFDNTVANVVAMVGSSFLAMVVMIFLLAFIFFKSDVQPYMFTLLIVPVFIAASQVGLLPSFFWSVGIVALGLVLGIGLLRLFK